MPPPSVILRDFDPDVQRKIHFHPGVCASFFDPQYTDQNDAELAWAYSPPNEVKKREVKYGNNIATLFKALYHLREYYHWPQFWHVVASGWKSNARGVEVIVSILTEARLVYRQVAARDREPCQTAKAVDLWIDFLRSSSKMPRPPPSSFNSISEQAYTSAKDFYTNMKSRMVNAARIQRDSKQPSPSLSTGLPAGTPTKPAGSHKQPPIVKAEGQGSVQGYDRNNIVRSSRKRSLSPLSSESPKSKRANTAKAGASRPEEPTTQDERKSQAASAHPQASPSVSNQDVVHSNVPPQAERTAGNGGQPPEISPESIDRSNAASTGSVASTVAEDRPDKAKAESKLTVGAAIARIQQSNHEIKGELASFKTFLESLTDSVAMIVNHVESLRKDVNELKQQREDETLSSEYVSKLQTLVQKAAADVTSLKADVVGLKIMSDARHQKQEEYQQLNQSEAARNLEAIQETTSCIKTMMDEISEVKCQQQLEPPPAPTIQLNDIKALMESLLAQQEKKFQSQLQTLLVPQEDKLKSQIEGLFAEQEAKINAHITSCIGNQTAIMDNLRQEIVGMASPPPEATPAQPPTLRGALVAAETDIQQHRGMIQKFYNQRVDRGLNITLTSKIADVLVALDRSLSTVQGLLGQSQ